MANRRVIALLSAVAGACAAVASADWKGDLAAKAVSRAAREGLEHAIKDAALDAGLAAASALTVTAAADRIGEAAPLVPVVAAGMESAMRVADVASTLDDAIDVAKTVKKIGKLRR